ncbi:MAG: succinyl-diaminopimelate desuccinylase [Pseudomonadota bacterium]
MAISGTRTDPVALAQALIRCPSVTPADAGALDLIENALAAMGFECTRLPFGEGAARIDNLYARLGDAPPHFCFAGHSDVVPAGDRTAWSVDPFAGETKGPLLIGRGAADMKGAIAAFISGVELFLARNGTPPGSISCLITGDEEGVAANGTVKVLEWLAAHGERIDHCLVGEPTSRERLGDTLKNGRRGSLNAWIKVQGAQGHVAYPQHADNPIPRLVRFLDAVMARRLDEGTPAFDPSHLEVTDIAVGNGAENVIPATASARLNIRFNDRHQGADLVAWLEEVASATAGEHELATRVSGEAFLTPEGPFSRMLCAAVAAVEGIRPTLSTSGGTSDARFIARHCPVVELGLVGATMHKADEAVPADDIRRLARIYEAVLQRYFVPETQS